MRREGEKESLPDHLRCKRTDGRQWRCNRRVLQDKKLCEVHHIQGRHRQHREKVPESLKLQRKNKKIFKQQARAHKFKKLRNNKFKKQPVISESEAVDEAVKRLKLKRGDVRLELIRMVLKRQVEKRRNKQKDSVFEKNGYNSYSDTDEEEEEEQELTKELPYGVMAISCTNSDNAAGTSTVAKIGSETPAVIRRRFRSKNIEPMPVATLQAVPYKMSLNKRKRCHWCRKASQNLIKCSSCRKLFFCVDCVKDRYFDMQEDIKKECPVCRRTCGCKVCSSSQCRDTDYKDLFRDRNEVEKVLHYHYLICMLLPVVKRINQDQSVELETEAQMKGLKPSEVQIQQAELNCNRLCCCNSCKTSIDDLHRSCASCSYTLCLSCCRDIRRGSLSGSIKALICKCPNGMKPCTSGVRHLDKKSLSTYKQSYSRTYFDSFAPLPSCKASDGSVGISCPPTELGGCGDSLLDLTCVFPLSWTKELENSAEQIVGCYELPETLDSLSCCSLCPGMNHDDNGIKQLQEAATRENSNDNFLFYPTVTDVHCDMLEHFQKHWGKGHPVIVRNVLQGTSELSWDPIVMFCTYLKNNGAKSENDEGAVKDAECLDWFEVEIGIRQLFLGSLRGQCRANMCDERLKLKGWLSSRLFQEQFPAHYAKIIEGLPLQEYMDPKSGVLNIASDLTQKSSKPDQGPCVFISYASGEELVQADSVTKLCYDLCDVVNILAHTTDVPVSTKQLNKIRELMKKNKGQDQSESSDMAKKMEGKSSLDGQNMGDVGLHDMVEEEIDTQEACDLNLKDRNMSRDEECDSDSTILCSGTVRSSKTSEKMKDCGAEWDVFRRRDVPKLIEYLERHCNEFSQTNGFRKHVVHPIFDQNFFLDATHKMRLKEEFEIEPWTFKQHVGEAVIIPAGCPYQIRNLKSCVSVVLDFVSPENVTESLHLIDELRLLPNDHKAKANKLEVKKMALYSISTAVKEIRELTCAEKVKANTSDNPTDNRGQPPNKDDARKVEAKASNNSIEHHGQSSNKDDAQKVKAKASNDSIEHHGQSSNKDGGRKVKAKVSNSPTEHSGRSLDKDDAWKDRHPSRTRKKRVNQTLAHDSVVLALETASTRAANRARKAFANGAKNKKVTVCESPSSSSSGEGPSFPKYIPPPKAEIPAPANIVEDKSDGTSKPLSQRLISQQVPDLSSLSGSTLVSGHDTIEGLNPAVLRSDYVALHNNGNGFAALSLQEPGLDPTQEVSSSSQDDVDDGFTIVFRKREGKRLRVEGQMKPSCVREKPYPSRIREPNKKYVD